MRTFTGGTFVAVTFLALSGLAPSTAAADPVADFYRGKSISMVIATAPGGDYDLRARLVVTPHGPPHPWQSDHRAAQHAGRRRHPGHELHGQRRAQGRHGDPRHHAEHVDPSGARRHRRRVRHPQVLLDRQHHRHAERHQLVAYHRHPHDPGRHDAGAGGRRARAGDQLGLLSEGAERAGRHQVQDRLGLSRRQRRQPGDGARRGRRPRIEFMGLVESDQAGLAARQEDLHAGADRPQARSGAGRHPDHDRARQDRRGQGGDDLPVGRRPDQPRLRDHAGRAGRAGAGAAPRFRRHHEGPGVPRGSGEAQHGPAPVDRRGGAALLGPDRQYAGAQILAKAKAIIESK